MVQKIYRTAMFIFLFGISLAQGNAQGLFNQWAIGVEAGTYGPGITVATSLSPHFKLKAGFDYATYTYKDDIDIDVDGYHHGTENYVYNMSGAVIDPKLKFTNFKAIIDYYPMQNGIFSLSAGFYAGNNTVSAAALINDYAGYGTDVLFDIDGVTVHPNADGSFDAKVKLGKAIKPYFGIGLGRTIANSRLGFKFDLGIIYQGKYKISSSNADNTQINQHTSNYLTDELDIPEVVFKLWPMLNFSLSYRIF